VVASPSTALAVTTTILSALSVTARQSEAFLQRDSQVVTLYGRGRQRKGNWGDWVVGMRGGPSGRIVAWKDSNRDGRHLTVIVITYRTRPPPRAENQHVLIPCAVTRG
ncbi:hypothetical protein THAOC_30770, partial [Thalassiosira oceanica]